MASSPGKPVVFRLVKSLIRTFFSCVNVLSMTGYHHPIVSSILMQGHTIDSGMSLKDIVRQITHNNLLFEQEIQSLRATSHDILEACGDEVIYVEVEDDWEDSMPCSELGETKEDPKPNPN